MVNNKENSSLFSRKDFLKLGGMGMGSIILSQSFAFANASPLVNKSKAVKFGIISDLHYDLMHDSAERAQKFIDEMKAEQPDFIIQLGDFCVPKPANQKLMDIWNQFSGDKYHVLGNHDTDNGFKKEEALSFWKTPAAYYSFDKSGIHFVVLDGNEKNEKSLFKGYPRYIGKEQLHWLKEDLRNTNLRTVLFCHQGLDNTDDGIENGMEVRYLLEQINKEAGFNKVIMVFSGHHHSNYYNHINDIHYVQINSSSYYWVDESYKGQAFSEDFYKQYPLLRHTIIYKDPIWAMVTMDAKNKIEIKGKDSEFVGGNQPIPSSLTDVYPVTAKIDNRILKF